MQKSSSGGVPPIQIVVLDFDGTCTQIPPTFERYLDHFGQAFVKEYRHLSEHNVDPLTQEEFGPLTEEAWRDAIETVRGHSPRAAWMVAGCPAAPAAADPYILADESAKYIFRRRQQHAPPQSFHEGAYNAFPAPWREEVLDVFSRLVELGVKIHFVSNSGTVMIRKRLDELFDTRPKLREHVSVQGDAGKFRICEPQWDRLLGLSVNSLKVFAALPSAMDGIPPEETQRPVYLRRGSYFEAIDAVLRGHIGLISNTLFCGDIWEMDLAMPHALGAKVHLLDREPPFDTYDYEREAIKVCSANGRNSTDLLGLLDWF